MRPEPIFAAVEAADPPRPLLLLGPGGRRFDQAVARELAALDGFSLLCGRYEGVDHRIRPHLVDDELSVGDVVLAGGRGRRMSGHRGRDPAGPRRDGQRVQPCHGELRRPWPARGAAVHPPGGLPRVGSPDVLRSGDHARVARWRLAQALHRTIAARPDLIEGRGGVTVRRRSGCWKSSRRSRILDEPSFGTPLGCPAMKVTDLIDNESLRDDIPDFAPGDEVKVHVRVVEGNKERVPADLPGRRHRPSGWRAAGDVHRPQAELRRRRRAHVPAAHTDGHQDRGRQPRRCPPGEAVLPPRSHGQGRQGPREGRLLGSDSVSSKLLAAA